MEEKNNLKKVCTNLFIGVIVLLIIDLISPISYIYFKLTLELILLTIIILGIIFAKKLINNKEEKYLGIIYLVIEVLILIIYLGGIIWGALNYKTIIG